MIRDENPTVCPSIFIRAHLWPFPVWLVLWNILEHGTGYLCPVCLYSAVCIFFSPASFVLKAVCTHCSARKTEAGCCLSLMALCSPHSQGTHLLLTLSVAQLWSHRAPAFHVWFLISIVRAMLLLCGLQGAGLLSYHVNELMLLCTYLNIVSATADSSGDHRLPWDGRPPAI